MAGPTTGDQFSASLKAQRTHVTQAQARLQGNIHRQLEAALRQLPIGYLKEHNLLDEVKQKGVQKFMDTLVASYRWALGQAWLRWRRHVADCRERDRQASALCIQCMVRRKLALFRAQHARYLRAQAVYQRDRELRALWGQREQAACTVQHALRTHHVRLAYAAARRRECAARVIQRAWDRRSGVMEGLVQVAKARRQQIMAGKIQRAFRGHLVRRRLPFLRRERRREQLEVDFKDSQGLFRAYLTQHGAAVIIQEWWRHLPWRMRALRARYRRILDKNATEIQRMARGYLTRRLVAALLMETPPEAGRSLRANLAKTNPGASAAATAGWAAVTSARSLRREELLGSTGPLAAGRTAGGRHASVASTVSSKTTASELASTALETISGVSPMGRNRKKRQERAAVVVQKWVRRFLVRARICRAAQCRLDGAAATIQKNHRAFRHNRRLLVLQAAFGAVCRHRVTRFAREQVAAASLSAFVKTWLLCRRYVRTRRLAVLAQSLCRMWLARRRVERLWMRRLRWEEDHAAGAKQSAATAERWYKRTMHENSCIEDPLFHGELQGVFRSHCQFGDKKNLTKLDPGKVLKICLDAPGLIDSKVLTKPAVELLVSKLKPKGQQHLTYPNLLAILSALAEQHPKIKSIQRNGPCVGPEARYLTLVEQHILSGTVGKAQRVLLEKEGRDARAVSQRVIGHAAAKITGLCVIAQARRRAAALRRARGERYKEAARLQGALLLQRLFRRILGLRRSQREAQKVLMRCVDTASNVEFYFNPRTGRSSWTRPKALGPLFIETAIRMPAGDQIILVTCAQCNERRAEMFCVECGDPYCPKCDAALHEKGKSRLHVRVPMPGCIECQFQTATKKCLKCGDVFCDSCFAFVHRKGRLQTHGWEALVGMCVDCGDSVHLQRCLGCDATGALLLCRKCQTCRHAVLESMDGHGVEEVKLVPMAMGRVLEQRREEEYRRRMQEESAKMAAEKRLKLMNKKATKIQAVWRGYCVRLHWEDTTAKRRAWICTRKEEDKVRAMPRYKLLDELGRAPPLQSDTDREKVLKQFPAWERQTVADVVGSDWAAHAKMAREQEYYSRKLERTGKSQAWRLARQVRAHERKLKQMGPKTARLRRAQQKAGEAYRAARYRPEASKLEVERFQQASRRAKHVLKLQEDLVAQAEKRQAELEAALEHLVGPNRLHKTVARVRVEGMPLPFVVDVETATDHLLLPANQSLRQVGKLLKRKGARVRIGEDLSSTFCVRRADVAPSSFRAPAAKPGPRSRHASLATTDAGSVAEQPEAKGGGSVGTVEEVLRPFLEVDRHWMDGSAGALQVYRMPVLPLHLEAALALRRWVHGSVPVQLPVKAMVVWVNMARRRVEALQGKFDEDSATYRRLDALLDSWGEVQDRLMRQRTRPFDPDVGFGLRGRFGRARGKLDAHFSQAARIQAAEDLLRKGAEDLEYLRQLLRQQAGAAMAQWQASDDKDKVTVQMRTGTRAQEKLDRLGEFDIDLDCPVAVLREYIRRYFGPLLNENGVGEEFLMETSNGKVLPLLQEGTPDGHVTGGAKAYVVLDMLQSKTDSRTRRTESLITIVPSAAPPQVPDGPPPVVQLIPEADFLSEGQDVEVGSEPTDTVDLLLAGPTDPAEGDMDESAEKAQPPAAATTDLLWQEEADNQSA